MSGPFDVSLELAGFSGTAPLFPLPNCVLFPHVMLPLHIFEARYRQMTADALATNRLIAMALLKSAPVDEEPDAIYPDVCLGHIVAEKRLADGRYYLVLRGIARARVEREVPLLDLPYRVGELSLVGADDEGAVPFDSTLRSRLFRLYRHVVSDASTEKALDEIAASDAPLGVICDLLADALELAVEDRQRMLATADVADRAGLLLQCLERLESGPHAPGTFPPPFSAN